MTLDEIEKKYIEILQEPIVTLYEKSHRIFESVRWLKERKVTLEAFHEDHYLSYLNAKSMIF
jgi:hypothetical protein